MEHSASRVESKPLGSGFERLDDSVQGFSDPRQESVAGRRKVSVANIERIRIGGRFLERTLTRSEKMEDNDLPITAQKYCEFLQEMDG